MASLPFAPMNTDGNLTAAGCISCLRPRDDQFATHILSTVYQTVAQVLTYVFQLRVAKRSGFQPPPRPGVTVEE